MDRTLTIRKGSSPSYTFTITDVEGSGLNIDSEEFGVGMTISKGGDPVRAWTVVPLTVGGGNVEGYFKETNESNIVFFSNTLCRRISTATTTRFIVTIPISITNQIDVSDEYTYEAFLFGIKLIEGSKGILYNIPIDSGRVNVVASAIPIGAERAKRSALTVV